MGRLLYSEITMHICNTRYPVVIIALICFSIVDPSRYGVNLCKILNISDSKIGRVFAHLRWNTFLICYPLGAICDGLCAYYATEVVARSDPMMYSVTMPNSWNVAFNFHYFLRILPVGYVAIFPGIYSYLLAQRKAFYNEKKKTD